MGVDVRRATGADFQDWDDAVEQSAHGTFFHQHDALQVQAEHAGADLHPLVGYKGEEPVGVFPVFELEKGPFVGAFSPPPYLWVGYLGPALVNTAKLSRRKTERRNEGFVEGCWEWIADEVGPAYAQVTTPPRYRDVRPFKWNDCSLTPEYTYAVDLRADQEELLAGFSSDARSNVRDAEAADYEVEVGGSGAIAWIVEQIQRRHDAQGRRYPDLTGFVTDLHERLPDGQVMPYVLRVAGKPVGGLIAVGHADTVYRWQGGVTPDVEVDLAVNDLLDWHVMCDAAERGRVAYDLVGAGVPRINRYKAKFNPRLSTFYRVEYGSWGAPTLASVYRQLSAHRPSWSVR